MSPATQQTKSPVEFFLLTFALAVPFLLVSASTGIELLPGLPIAGLAVVCPALAALILMYRAWGPPGARGIPLAAGGEPTPEMRKRLARRLASDLNLSDAQRVKVEELMEQQMPRMRATGDSVQALVERSLAESREQMMKILTPEQQRKFSTIMPAGRLPGRPPGR